MTDRPMKRAAVLAEGGFATNDAKTAAGLVRYSRKYRIGGVIDSRLAGGDAGEALDGRRRNIPIYAGLDDLLRDHPNTRHLLVGLNPIGDHLPERARTIIRSALQNGLSVVNGLHTHLSDDPDLSELARRNGARLTDVRKGFNNHRIFFSGKIEEVTALKVAVLGTDSSVGKRSTAIALHEAFNALGRRSTFVAMGQTGWMQGFPYAIVVDAIIADFMAGAIEDVIWRAWKETDPEIIVTHGEGSILHPAYPGGFELLAAGRPDVILLHHAPAVPHFDGFPQYPKPPLERFIEIIRLLSDKTPAAITLNCGGMTPAAVRREIDRIETVHGIPAVAPFHQDLTGIAKQILRRRDDGSPGLGAAPRRC